MTTIVYMENTQESTYIGATVTNCKYYRSLKVRLAVLYLKRYFLFFL